MRIFFKVVLHHNRLGGPEIISFMPLTVGIGPQRNVGHVVQFRRKDKVMLYIVQSCLKYYISHVLCLDAI